MEEYLLTIMKRASIFMVLSQAVIHFRPNPSYEKYFRFLVGIMTVVILAVPLMELTHSKISGQYEESLKAYERKVEEALSRQPENAVVSQKLYLSQIEEEIKIKLNNFTEQEGYYVKEVNAAWDHEEDTLSVLQITLAKKGRADISEEIEIGQIRITQPRTEEDSPEAEKLRGGIAQTLAIEKEKVEVRIVE